MSRITIGNARCDVAMYGVDDSPLDSRVSEILHAEE